MEIFREQKLDLFLLSTHSSLRDNWMIVTEKLISSILLLSFRSVNNYYLPIKPLCASPFECHQGLRDNDLEETTWQSKSERTYAKRGAGKCRQGFHTTRNTSPWQASYEHARKSASPRRHVISRKSQTERRSPLTSLLRLISFRSTRLAGKPEYFSPLVLSFGRHPRI